MPTPLKAQTNSIETSSTSSIQSIDRSRLSVMDSLIIIIILYFSVGSIVDSHKLIRQGKPPSRLRMLVEQIETGRKRLHLKGSSIE